MSRYILIRRLREPAILLLIGTLALLRQMGLIPYFWRLMWPLLLIMVGLLMLAERAALAWEGYPPCPGQPGYNAGQEAGPGAGQGMNPGTNAGTNAGAPFQGAPSQGAGQGEAPSGALVAPPQWQEFDDKKGGQS